MHVTDNRIFNTRNLEAGIFLLMGAAKTVHDYRSVGEKYKQKILLNDVVVLGASSAGMLGYRALGHNKTLNNKLFKPTVEYVHDKFKKFYNSDFAQKHLVGKFDHLYKPLQTPIEYSKNIIASSISNTAMVGAGLFSAILADFILTKNGLGIHKLKNKKEDIKPPKQLVQVEKFKKNNVDTVVSKDLQEEMLWRMTDFKIFNPLNSAFVGLAGLDITDDEKYSKQVKNASKYLLLNTLVPLFFFSLSSALTKKMKNIYRFPIMFAALVTGSLLVKNAVDKSEKHPKN